MNPQLSLATILFADLWAFKILPRLYDCAICFKWQICKSHHEVTQNAERNLHRFQEEAISLHRGKQRLSRELFTLVLSSGTQPAG